MTYQRVAYDDTANTSQMTRDCLAVERSLRIPHQVPGSLRGPKLPSPATVRRSVVTVSDAATRLASKVSPFS